jgi:hypothetical protein
VSAKINKMQYYGKNASLEIQQIPKLELLITSFKYKNLLKNI